MQDQNDCQSCQWFELFEKGMGCCHRYAPRPDRSRENEKGDYMQHHADWPRVNADDWCGEYATHKPRRRLSSEH